MNKSKLSAVLLVCDEKALPQTVSDLVSQDGVLCGLDVIFTDLVCTETTKSEYSRISEKLSCRYISSDTVEGGLSEALGKITASAFLVLRAGTVYTQGALDRAVTALENGGAVSFRPRAVQHLASRMSKSLMENHQDYERYNPQSGYVDFFEYPQAAHTVVDAYVFSSALLEGVSVDMDIGDEALNKFTLTILSKIKGCTRLGGDMCIVNTPLEFAAEAFSAKNESRWYIPSVENFFIPFLCELSEAGRLSDAVQYAASGLMMAKFFCNYEDKNTCVLAEKEDVFRFFAATGEALRYIKNEIYLRWCEDHRWTPGNKARKIYFNRALAFVLLRAKAQALGGTLDIKSDPEYISISTPDGDCAKVCRASDEIINIGVINFENGRLYIDGTFSAADFLDREDIKLFAEFSGNRTALEYYPIYPLFKCFGVTVAHKYSVHFSIPADIGTTCRFIYCVDGREHSIKLSFNEQFSRLVTDKPQAYWCFDKKRCLVCQKSRTLKVEKLTALGHVKRELKLLAAMPSFPCPSKSLMLVNIAIRCLYRITKPFYGKKRRWMTFDKLYKGGDNGEYFFRYSAGRKDKVRVYYIVDKNTKEYKALKKKYRYVLKSISPRTMLTTLNSEAIAATHSMIISYLGFPRSSQPFLRDLFNFKVCCIQHGLTVQQLAQYQNRTFDNTTLYCLASHFEYENLMKPIYGFEEKHLKMTGLARFDGLKNNDKKFILITPTWRRNVVAAGIANIKKAHSDAFRDSEYFRLYNTLINDEKLISCAKETGYGITYLLHPAMSAQIDDFDRNDYVRLVAATGDMNYEEILTQASLMVTDYSGVQFDFAYMRKPVVYYHPDTLPPQYESGSIDYPTTGFGPILTDNDSLVESLCDYMCRGCENTPEYIARADSFFAYSDYNNCGRIYEEMLKFTKPEKKGRKI